MLKGDPASVIRTPRALKGSRSRPSLSANRFMLSPGDSPGGAIPLSTQEKDDGETLRAPRSQARLRRIRSS